MARIAPMMWGILAAVGLLGMLRGAKASVPDTDTRPARDPEKFRELWREAEQSSGLRGLAKFLEVLAFQESRFDPDARNDDDASNARKLYLKNAHDIYADNLTKNPDAWAFSGGLYGLMPATALVAAPSASPLSVMNPRMATFYATDLVNRLIVKYGARNWGDVRAGWKFPRFAYPSNHDSEKAAVIERFANRAAELGFPGLELEAWKETPSA